MEHDSLIIKDMGGDCLMVTFGGAVLRLSAMYPLQWHKRDIKPVEQLVAFLQAWLHEVAKDGQ